MAILELKLWYLLSWSSFSIGSLQPKRAATAPQHCSLVHKKNNNKCESIYYLVWHTSSMAEMRYLVCWLRYPTRRSSCFSISPILWLGGQHKRQSNLSSAGRATYFWLIKLSWLHCNPRLLQTRIRRIHGILPDLTKKRSKNCMAYIFCSAKIIIF